MKTRKAVKKVTATLDQRKLSEIKQAFQLFDTDNTGYIDSKQLRVAMRALGFDIRKEQAKKICTQTEGKSVISFQQFQNYAGNKMIERSPQQQIKKAFELFDSDGNGKININDLRQVATELSLIAGDQQLQMILRQASKSKDSVICYQQFADVMIKSKMF